MGQAKESTLNLGLHGNFHYMQGRTYVINDSFPLLTHTHTQALTAVNVHKPQLSSIEQLSTQLLYLEPIFSGDPVRDEMQTLSKDYQSLVLEIFDLLEGQARSRTEQLLMDVSVMSSWVTVTELSVQALAKRSRKPNGMSTKIAATREVLVCLFVCLFTCW